MIKSVISRNSNVNYWCFSSAMSSSLWFRTTQNCFATAYLLLVQIDIQTIGNGLNHVQV